MKDNTAHSTFYYHVKFDRLKDKLDDYPWLKNLDQLWETNRYRVRVGQSPIELSDEDMTRLALTSM